MGSPAQQAFLRDCINKGFLPDNLNRVMYSGAANDQESLRAFAELFPRATLTTTDIEPGPSVGLVWNQELPPPPEYRQQVDLFISTSVLEHVQHPWQAALNIEDCLAPASGFVYISVPWVWRYHQYPDDYWRFSATSLDIIFQKTKPLITMWSTSPDELLHPANPYLDNQMSLLITGQPSKKLGRKGLFALLLKQLFSGAGTHKKARKYLPYLLLHQLRVVSA